MTKDKEIFNAIKQGFETKFEIASYTGLSDTYVGAAITSLLNKGLIFKASHMVLKNRKGTIAIYKIADEEHKKKHAELNLMLKSAFRNPDRTKAKSIMRVRGKREPYSNDEMDYGLTPSYTWDEVSREADIIRYNPNDKQFNKLSYERERKNDARVGYFDMPIQRDN